jgi:hypothetical protein
MFGGRTIQERAAVALKTAAAIFSAPEVFVGLDADGEPWLRALRGGAVVELGEDDAAWRALYDGRAAADVASPRVRVGPASGDVNGRVYAFPLVTPGKAWSGILAMRLPPPPGPLAELTESLFAQLDVAVVGDLQRGDHLVRERGLQVAGSRAAKQSMRDAGVGE